MSSSVKPTLASYKKITKSASSADCFENSIPISSTFPTSSQSLIPAVSIKVTATSKSNVSLITSLVVPAISVTIARFAFNNELNKEDLPTLGRPTIATLIPCRKIFDDLAQDKILSISAKDFSKLAIR